MANSGSTPEDAISAENIALFALLHEVPVQPSTNEAGQYQRLSLQKQIDRPAYTLDFQTEKRLVDTLAFLSSIKKDPDHIPAVCISENADVNTLDVYIAVNKTSCQDGITLLQDIVDGFERIFGLLDNRSSPGTQQEQYCHTIKHQVFSAVVSMCSSRILQRLRLRGKKRSSTYLKQCLSTVIKCGGQQKESISDSVLFLTKAKESIRLLDTWLNHQVPERLEDIVEGIYRLHKTGTVRHIFDNVSDKDMEKSQRLRMVNIIEKVARYRQAARFLYRVAAKGALGKRLRAIPVNLPKEFFERPVPGGYSPRLESVLSRMGPEYGKGKKLVQIRKLLISNPTSVDDKFSGEVSKILNEAKIHAEIQLLTYCEFQLPTSCSRPRVICSCKDACYLCNLAITECQRKMYTPRSHGRLYPSWQLPLQYRQLRADFNQKMESEIRKSLKRLLEKRQKLKIPGPHESRLGTLSPSETTLCSSSILSRVTRRDLVGQRTPVYASQSDVNLGESLKQPPERVIHQNSSQDNSHQQNDTMPDQRSRKSRESVIDKTLVQESAVKQTITAHHATPLYANGILEVQIELEPPNPTGSGAEQKHLNVAYSIGRLDGAVQRQDWCHPQCIVDTMTLHGEVLHELCNQKRLCLRWESTVITLVFF